MILVDSSIWITHLRSELAELSAALGAGLVLIHPLVIGEVACGNVGNRLQVLTLLQELPRVPMATDEETLAFIEARSLMGKGIGYIDAHLLASLALSDGAHLWTNDRRLRVLAQELGFVR